MHSFRTSIAVVTAAVCVFAAPMARADMPRLIDFQGVARTAAGGPIAGPVNIQVTLYDAAAGGAVLFGPEAHNATPLTGSGLFNILIGSKTALGVPTAAFAHTEGTPAQVWLGVKIGADPEMTPRIRLVAAPYAYRVDRVASPELDDVINLGSPTSSGALDVFRSTQATSTIRLMGSGHRISTYGNDEAERVRIWGPSWGEIYLFDQTGNELTATLSANANSGGSLSLLSPTSGPRIQAQGADSGAWLRLNDGAGQPTLMLRGDYTGAVWAEGALRVVDNVTSATPNTYAVLNQFSGGGRLQTMDESFNSTVLMGSSNSAGGFVELYQANGTLGMNVDGDATGANGGGVLNVYRAGVSSPGITVDGSGTGGGGELTVRDADGTNSVVIQGSETSTTGARVLLRKADGTTTITLDADFSGDGRIITQELQITGGSDLSEQFDIASTGSELLPGMVVSIDPTKPGNLVISQGSYDRTVAGIVSGAGGVKPGMLMGQKGTVADGRHPVALTGRVYCLADATAGPIVPGDLLTSSDTPGHAMKVSDHGKAQGAIIGKAMTGLESGKGLVLVLVSLQ